MTEIKPLIDFREDVLELHKLYLEKVELLSDREREAFCDYFHCLSRPMMVVNDDIDFSKFNTEYMQEKP